MLALALLLFAPKATAQNSPDPASLPWGVELDGVLQPGEVFLFHPDSPWSSSGTWINLNATTTFGWGTYDWHPLTGTIDYVNQSGDGGGIQTGEYEWSLDRYERLWSSHPQAKPMSLLPPVGVNPVNGG